MSQTERRFEQTKTAACKSLNNTQSAVVVVGQMVALIIGEINNSVSNTDFSESNTS